MKVGILSSSLNIPGGAEFVSLNMIKTLNKCGFKIVLLSSEKINNDKIQQYYGTTLSVDSEVVIPDLFAPYDIYGVYMRGLKNIILSKLCDVVVDNYSSTIFPWVDISYIHFPYEFKINNLSSGKKIYFFPYNVLINKLKNNINRNITQKVILSNSMYTAKSVKHILGLKSQVLYPPVKMIYELKDKINMNRTNDVITISRFSEGKNLEVIPITAKQTNNAIKFIIAGGYDAGKTLYLIKKMINELELTDRIKLVVNSSRDNLIKALKNSKVYLHTMQSEHFGISIVEAMSAGCIPIVPNSGGPKEFVPSSFRYNNIDEVGPLLEKYINEWNPSIAKKMIKLANKYSEEKFSENFSHIILSLYEKRLKK